MGRIKGVKMTAPTKTQLKEEIEHLKVQLKIETDRADCLELAIKTIKESAQEKEK